MVRPVVGLSAEWRLALACCAHAIGAAAAPDGGAEVDTDRFLAVVERHRIGGLVRVALGASRSPPERLAGTVDRLGRGAAEEGLRAALECRRLRDAFAAQGVDLLFLKGLAVGKLALGNALVKRSWDIDVLVAEGEVERAGAVLRELGYACSVAALGRWHRVHKESVWHEPGGAVVELHSRLADNRRLIAGIGMGSPRQAVEVVPGVVLETLAGDELLAYLAVHGASSAWFRLKWITEFSGLLGQRPAGEIDRVAERLEQLGAGRAAGQALVLSHWLFGTALPSRWASDAATRRLARWALAQLQAEREPTERPLGTATIHLSQLLLLQGPGFALAEAGRQAREVLDRRLRR